MIYHGYILATGLDKVDKLLTGGLKGGKLYHIYGPSSVGKTTFALQLACFELSKGNKVIWVDCEWKDFTSRLSQMVESVNLKSVLSRLLVFKLRDFSQQSLFLDKLPVFINGKTKLVVLDTVTGLYSAALTDRISNVKLNKELSRQIALLKSVCIQHGVIVLLLNRVRFKPESGNIVEPAASNIINYWCDFCFEMSEGDAGGKKLNIVSCQDGREIGSLKYVLVEKGLKVV